MTNENLKYGFEHWMEFHTLLRTIESNMVEVPEGKVNIGSVKDIGFLVDYYMPRRQVSAAIVNTLELSEYSAVYKRNGS